MIFRCPPGIWIWQYWKLMLKREIWLQAPKRSKCAGYTRYGSKCLSCTGHITVYYSNSHHMSPRNPSTKPQYSWASTISWKSEADNGLKWSEMIRAYAILGNFKQSFPVDVCIHCVYWKHYTLDPLDCCTDWVPPPVRPWNDVPAIPSRHPKRAPLHPLKFNAISLTPATCGYSWISLGWFYMVLLYYVILRVVSNLQFVYFSSLGPPLTLVISGHLWTFAELQQLQRHVQRYQGIN